MLYNLFYQLYFIRLSQPTLDSLLRRIMIRLVNILMPLYFQLTSFLPKNRLQKTITGTGEDDYIVSLTTFPKRIHKVWLTIETILRQDVKPDAVILWLYEGEFTGKSSLPATLLAQEKRGLQIRFCKENLMPHKKYYYAFLEHPKSTIITIDDDVLYPTNLISTLLFYHKKYPNTICSTNVRKISVEKNKTQEYRFWNHETVTTNPLFSNLAVGVGGVLYPSNSLHKDVFDIENLKKLSLQTDDLWLKIMSIKNKVRVVGLGGEYSKPFIPIIINDNIALMDDNIGNNKNDENFRVLAEYYEIKATDFYE
jgi:hypothetical protein